VTPRKLIDRLGLAWLQAPRRILRKTSFDGQNLPCVMGVYPVNRHSCKDVSAHGGANCRIFLSDLRKAVARMCPSAQ